MKNPQIINAHPHLILFDGVCNLCSGFLQFVYKHDKRGIFKFAWIQDDVSGEILNWLDMPTDQFDTIVLIKDGQAYFKSTAFLEIVNLLKFPWPLLYMGIIIPLRIRDKIYDWVAENRYRWFGRKDSCMVPRGGLRDRFLSTNYTN